MPSFQRHYNRKYLSVKCDRLNNLPCWLDVGLVTQKYLKANFIIRTFIGASLNLRAVSQNHCLAKLHLKTLVIYRLPPTTCRTHKYVVRSIVTRLRQAVCLFLCDYKYKVANVFAIEQAEDDVVTWISLPWWHAIYRIINSVKLLRDSINHVTINSLVTWGTTGKVCWMSYRFPN